MQIASSCISTKKNYFVGKKPNSHLVAHLVGISLKHNEGRNLSYLVAVAAKKETIATRAMG